MGISFIAAPAVHFNKINCRWELVSPSTVPTPTTTKTKVGGVVIFSGKRKKVTRGYPALGPFSKCWKDQSKRLNQHRV